MLSDVSVTEIVVENSPLKCYCAFFVSVSSFTINFRR